jgi:hypothetical protein
VVKMAPTSQSVSSLLVFDISPHTTQVCLVKRQEGIYRIMGTGRAPTSISAQGTVNRKSILKALEELTTNTGHAFLLENGNILIPSATPTRGVDRMCLTWSLPAPIKVALVGLMPAWSINAGTRLVEELPLEIIDQIATTDGRSDEDRMDAILSKRPDLIIMTGGVEGGANEIVRSSADLVARTLATLPQDLRPEVIYAGNSEAAEYVKSKLESLTLIFTAPNIQPSLSELDIQPAREVLSGVCNRIWVKRFDLQTGTKSLAFDQLRPTMRATEDFIAILGLCEKRARGALAIQLNGLATALSVSQSGKSMSYQQQNGCLLVDPGRIINEYNLQDVQIWSPEPVEQSSLVEHLAAEALYPGRLPVSSKDAALAESLIRLTGMRTWKSLCEKQDFPRNMRSLRYCAETDIVLITGNRFHQLQHQGQAMLQMLDIIQPVGLSEVFIDRDNLAASLGTAAQMDPKIPLHCILDQVIPRLATLIAPAHKSREGLRLLSLTLIQENGKATELEVKSGELTSIPLKPGLKAELKIGLHSGANLGARFDHGNTLTVVGSLLGIVIDARGRPLVPRKEIKAQQEWIKRSADQMTELVR